MTNKYPKMAEIKNDIREYGLYEVVDDFEIYQEGNYRLALDILLEDDMVIIVLNAIDNGVLSQGAYGVEKKEFLKYSDEDLRYITNQIIHYNMATV